MRFARRCDWPTEPNPLSAALGRLRAEGRPPIDLTESNPTRCGLAAPPDFFGALADPANVRYEPDPRGLASAREAVRAYYAQAGVRVGIDDIFLTAGTSEAYGFLLRLLADPGDAVLVPSPSYPLFDYLVSIGDADVRPYRLRHDGSRWAPDLDGLARELARRPAPKAVLAVHPNNPTGSFFSAPERRAIDGFAADAGAAVISDEVFLDFAGGTPVPGFTGENRALTFTLSGVSKVLALPQMKIGWIVLSGPEAARREAGAKLEVIADTYLTVNGPAQRALAGWLARRGEPLSLVRERLALNRRTLEAAFDGSARACALRAEAGWYGIIRFDGPEEAEETLALRLLEEDGVFVHPGYFFDFENGCHFVVSLLPEPAVFGEGIRRVAARLGGSG
ncbi:MAG TPA: pyridoxal phosphate-dependent aminotransferase [Candidatus Eisenbacteria bacterium]|nr:pyridoxal phosphate-dependent aminotransferase [Candidatus Eisenbacteria bacterium]